MKHSRLTMGGWQFAVATILLLGETAFAGSWAEKSGQLNSRGITKDEAVKQSAGDDRDTRNKLSMRRIRPQRPGPDWNADPTAIPFMLYQVNKRTDMPIYVDNDGLDVGTDELFDYLTIYLTAHGAFSFNEKETENLSKWLKRGGTLLLDDCYAPGSPFVDSVGPETGKMIPGAQAVMLLAGDKHVSDTFKMIYPTSHPGENKKGKPWQYFLLDDRPAVFFSPNDDGCAWEVSTPPSASNPIGEGIGHGGDNTWRELSYKWITNWMMFVYTH